MHEIIPTQVDAWNFMKIEKVNAPPPKPSIAFSLTKGWGRINSDKNLLLRLVWQKLLGDMSPPSC